MFIICVVHSSLKLMQCALHSEVQNYCQKEDHVPSDGFTVGVRSCRQHAPVFVSIELSIGQAIE